MGLSVRRVSVLMTALALLMSTVGAVGLAPRAEAVTCVVSSNEADTIGDGMGRGPFAWPGGEAKLKITYRTPSSNIMIRVRLVRNGNSTGTTLKGNAGRQVTKTVGLGYQPRSSTTLWFEPAGASPDSHRMIYSYCLYKA